MSRWGNYVNRRLDEMRDERDFEILNDFGESWPSTWLIEKARQTAGIYFSDGTPTPSVVPGGDLGQSICFIWHKGGWDLTLEVGLERTEVTAFKRSAESSNARFMEVYGWIDHKNVMDDFLRILHELEQLP